MSSRNTSRSLLLLAAVAAVSIGAAEAPVIRITPLAREGHVLVSFTLADGFTSDVRDAIQSGLTTTFSYDVDLKRDATFWFDHTLASTNVTASVKYDTLTRKFSLTRSSDGRIDEAESTDSEERVRQRLTNFDRLPLFSSAGLEPNGEYYLRVRAHTTPRTTWFFWSWWDRHEVAGIAHFTFIP